MLRVLTAAVLFVAVDMPAWAEPFAFHGLSFDLPEGYSAKGLGPSPDGSFSVMIEPPADGPKPMSISAPVLCVLNFGASLANQRKTQADLNAIAEDPDYPALGDLGPTEQFEKPRRETFSLVDGAITGRALYGVPLLGSDRRGIMYMSGVDVPKGSVRLNCAVMTDSFKAALPAIHAMRDSIVPPT